MKRKFNETLRIIVDPNTLMVLNNDTGQPEIPVERLYEHDLDRTRNMMYRIDNGIPIMYNMLYK